MSRYAAKVEDGTVTQVIRGDADWAEARLGGRWVGVEGKVGQGWEEWQPGSLRPPSPYESWTWDGSAWQPPVPQPSVGTYIWDEELSSWVDIGQVL